MVKLFCDRCGERIIDKYYTIAFTECYVDGKYRVSDCAIDALSTYVKPTLLEELNSQKMYCSECKNKLEFK